MQSVIILSVIVLVVVAPNVNLTNWGLHYKTFSTINLTPLYNKLERSSLLATLTLVYYLMMNLGAYP
jgi:hypothetical protein